MASGDPTPNMYYDPYQTIPAGNYCRSCGRFINGAHVCAAWPPLTKLGCEHCYCIDVPPHGQRTKPHVQCCHCGHTTAVQ
jgi:ribosomal protein L32